MTTEFDLLSEAIKQCNCSQTEYQGTVILEEKKIVNKSVEASKFPGLTTLENFQIIGHVEIIEMNLENSIS